MVDVEHLFQTLQKGDIRSLSRAITLVESNRDEDKGRAEELIRRAVSAQTNSHRIAVTGVPGVGKSTFIDAMGQELLAQGRRVAVLAIDPSSAQTSGSILGDKTRMEGLSADDRAYIRPSASAHTLGGVARKTREAMLLCEAAGFDLVIIETVGVGQSETSVRNMVDTFVLLMLAGAGDELQGIKRGIMEMADILLINKAEDANLPQARSAASNYRTALHLLQSAEETWVSKVGLLSSIEGAGLTEALEFIEEHRLHLRKDEKGQQARLLQNMNWFEETLNQEILEQFYSNKRNAAQISDARKAVLSGEKSPLIAAREIVKP